MGDWDELVIRQGAAIPLLGSRRGPHPAEAGEPRPAMRSQPPAVPCLAMDPERRRLLEVPRGRAPWRHWGPYLSERAWGTVREDYSPDGRAWESFPHDQARSRAYRWSEDGLGGLCDDRQTLCLALAMWNGRDPILKERLFGLTGNQGNHGEDVKEYWWYLDATPTHSYMRWRYHYPQAAYPYQLLVDENRRRGRLDPEYELVDTGIFSEGKTFAVTATYAKAGPEDIVVRIDATNHGPEPQTLHLLPTLWFRNTWSWGPDSRRPRVSLEGRLLRADHWELGTRWLGWDGEPTPLFCENETNFERLYGVSCQRPFPKDGIQDHVVHGLATVSPAHQGTKAALWYRLTLAAGGTASVRLRLRETAGGLGEDADQIISRRREEADQFYQALTPADASADEAQVMRQAFSGMLWSKQYYHYEVRRWLTGDPAQPTPPASRWLGRNHTWLHLDNRDVISMPDTWEYPWYAAWDLAFHCVALAHLDPEFAKSQLILLGREWYMHPSGQLPAYEWALGDVNPPVQAWAALRVFEIDGAQDHDFLERIFHKLLLNFTWWVNRKDAEGHNVFEGGFLGLDNIGPFDRSAALPVDGHLEQSDGTAWMAMYCQNLLEIALRLAEQDHTYEDIATKFFEHFTLIAQAMNQQGLWDEQDGFYYDVLHRATGERIPLRVRSAVGLVPLAAVTVLRPESIRHLHDFRRRMDWYTHHQPGIDDVVGHIHRPGQRDRRLLSIVDPTRLRRILQRMLDESEFLSPHGLRAVSRSHLENPLVLDLGGTTARVDYEPGESTSGLFGGNSNWRGPVWFPLNYLILEGLRRFHAYLGDDFTVECPTGSGRLLTLAQVVSELRSRLVSLFLRDASGRRPVFGDERLFQQDPVWNDLLPFHEYFHGDSGKGLGASHQTGWTGLVADLISGRRGDPAGR